MFGGVGMQEVLLILIVILLLFGARRIPEVARGLGKGIREFRRAARGIQEDLEEDEEPETRKAEQARKRRETSGDELAG